MENLIRPRMENRNLGAPNESTRNYGTHFGNGKSDFTGHGKMNTAWDHSPPEEKSATTSGK